MGIDKQPIEAVRTLEALGYTWSGEWLPPGGATPPSPLSMLDQADAMHAALMKRADDLAGCTPGSSEKGEVKAITDLIETYEAQRWSLGKDPGVPGGKG